MCAPFRGLADPTALNISQKGASQSIDGVCAAARWIHVIRTSGKHRFGVDPVSIRTRIRAESVWLAFRPQFRVNVLNIYNR